jgi:hypothetical protein
MRVIAVFHANRLGQLGHDKEPVDVPFDVPEGTVRSEFHAAAWTALRVEADRYYETHEHFTGPHRYRQ